MSLQGLPEGSIEKDIATHEVHIRNAHRLKELCFSNGGIYIKFGQHIGQLVSASPYVGLSKGITDIYSPFGAYDLLG